MNACYPIILQVCYTTEHNQEQQQPETTANKQQSQSTTTNKQQSQATTITNNNNQ